jgi:hypothetical protein
MATQVVPRQNRQIAPQNTAPPPSTAASSAAATQQQRLPQSTEERLAALRAAREKRKADVGALPNSPPTSALSTPNLASSSNTDLQSSAQQRLAMMRNRPQTGPEDPNSQPTGISSSMGSRLTPGGPPISVNSTPMPGPANPTPLPAGRSPSINGQTSGLTPQSAAGRTLPSRVSAAPVPANLQAMSRRPSQVVIEKEKKTDYWKDVEKTAGESGGKVNGDDLNNVISRAMSLGIVGDRKQRESLSGPQSLELLNTLKSSMEQKIVELNGGRKINFDALSGPNNNNIMEKIVTLEKALTTLESRKTQEEEEEKKRVQSKISELESSLKALESQKTQQREQNRRTMKLEIANLKEMMSKVQKEKDDETAAVEESKALSAKMNRLEAALRLMNEDRKKGTVEDKDTLLLRRKLALFEQKLQEMEAEKKMREEQDQGNTLRDKLLLMEDKLLKMEKRKSTSMSLQMQQKMEQVEKQLGMLRNERGANHTDQTNAKIAQKMALLEKQLQTMATTIVTPQMIQDEETVALRDHIKKLEESLNLQEKRMEDQRERLEEERKRNYEKRQAEEEEFRRQAKLKEEELVRRIAQMEAKIKNGPTSGGAVDPELIGRVKRLEDMGSSSISPDFSAKFTDIEKKLSETQKN